MGKLEPPHLIVLTNTLSPSVGFLTLPWDSGYPNSVRRGSSVVMPPGLSPVPPQGSGLQKPLRPPALWPQVLVSTPPPPQGPLPVPTSLFGFITLGGKRETFPFRPSWGRGLPGPLGLAGTLY